MCNPIRVVVVVQISTRRGKWIHSEQWLGRGETCTRERGNTSSAHGKRDLWWVAGWSGARQARGFCHPSPVDLLPFLLREEPSCGRQGPVFASSAPSSSASPSAFFARSVSWFTSVGHVYRKSSCGEMQREVTLNLAGEHWLGI